MKNSYFKKGFLSLVGLLFALVGNAQNAQTFATDYAPNGEQKYWESDIDFTKESLEVVVDLSNCGTWNYQDLLSVGEATDVLTSGYKGNVVHLWYRPGDADLTIDYYGGGKYNATKKSITTDEHTILLSKDGMFFDGELWEGEYGTSGYTCSNATALEPLLALTHIYFGPAYQSSYTNGSYATYKSVKIISNDGGTDPTDPETPEVEEPKTFTVSTTTQYLDEPKTNSETWKIDVPVDFAAGDSLEAVIDLTNSTAAYYYDGDGNDEDVISFGEELTGWSGNNLHFWYFGATKGWLRAEVPGGYRNNHENTTAGEHKLAITKNGLYLDGELWTGTSQNNSAVTKCDSTALANLLALKTLKVGCYEKAKGSVTKSITVYSTKTVTADTLALSAETPIIEYTPSAEHGNMFTAIVDPIDFQKQTLQATIDLSTCTDENEEVLTIGENTDTRDANWVRLTYSPANKTLNAQARYLYSGTTYVTLGPVDVTVEDPTNVVLSLDAINGLQLNGKVLEGEDPYGDPMSGASTIAFGAQNLSGLVTLNKVEVNSIYGDVRSHATYKTIEIVAAPATPDTVEIPLSDYTALEDHDYKFIGTTTIDWESQTLKAVIDVTNCSGDLTGAFENLLSVGYDITKEAGEALHLNYNSLFGGAANYVDFNGEKKSGAFTAPTSSKELTFEITAKTGLTLTAGGETTTILPADSLQTLLSMYEIQIGSLYSATNVLRSNATYKSIEVIDNPVEMPESIPFDLTEEGGWTATGEKFAWDADIDFTKQALEIVLDLSTCGSYTSNENVISVASVEEELPVWNEVTSDAGHIHFYYTKYSKKMEVDYLNTNGNVYRNANTTYFGNATDTILVCADGVKVNGQVWQGTSEYGDGTSFNDTQIAPFVTINHIWVGSQQGDNRSQANYRSIKIIDYAPVTTGISNVETEQTENAAMYNLAGQRVGKDYKGIVITNGKKLVRK